MKKFLLLTFLLQLSFFTYSQIPDGYYSNASGKTGAELKTALYYIIDGHNSLSYAALWDAFYYTDKKPNGKVWDMYSDNPDGTPPYEFTFFTDQCGNYSGENSCYNREHSFPKSWFNDGSPMYTDLFHLYPTDGYVNGMRSNYPYGEVSNPSWTSLNGSKVGSCSYPGYSGDAFEPIDEYKGDFARSYFYMATRYQNVISSWSSPMLNGTQYPAFSEWAVNMLIDWHNQDPVSQKEIDRNNEIYYEYQYNRNPYIDHPEYVNLVWGDGEVDSYDVTLLANPNDIGASLSGAGTYSEDDLVNISAGSVSDYAFTGWTGESEDVDLLDNASSMSTFFNMPPRNITLTANYQYVPPGEYNLVINIEGDGTVYINQEPYTSATNYENGEVLDLLAVADDGWSFVEYTGSDASTDSYMVITMDEDKNITATFEAESNVISEDEPIFKVYPNPFKDVINISYSGTISGVKIINVIGQTILDIPLDNASDYSLDTHQLNRGLYFLQIQDAKGNASTLKIIKE